jgi:quercetin dioxygenase-like cupin family protein
MKQIGMTLLMGLLLAPIATLAQSVNEQRLPLDRFEWSQPGGGSAMVPGQQTAFVVGDGKSKSLYSLVFKVPANAKIPAHSHPEDRSCFVLSGVWYFGYGNERREDQLTVLMPGSNYTEPAGKAHFAGTGPIETIVQCTAIGPTDTTFISTGDDPRNRR